MKPIMQTIFGKEKGNCLNACLASILEIPLEDVPWFGTGPFWEERQNKWLAQFDLVAIDIKVDSFYKGDLRFLGFHLINGPSPRGTGENEFWHSVVGYQGKMVHDPHPSGDGLLGAWTFTLFVRLFREGDEEE
jgi:hypothetical protein